MEQRSCPPLIDTHCHLDFPDFDLDRNDVLSRAREDGITHIVNIGSSLAGSRRSIELAAQFPSVYAVVGIHPHEADHSGDDQVRQIKDLAGSSKVVAIGEVGLDYYKGFSKQENQRPLFISLIRLAKEKELPLVIHTRQAQADTLSILKDFMPLSAVVHCFSGDAAFLQECLALGFMISFTCNITYPKAAGLRELAAAVPADRLMLETDAPFLSPEGLRGRRNEPAQVLTLARQIAALRNIPLEEAARITTDNARRFFKI
ncbi:MAG: TatD family hydrolase [Candidatus Omnitrophica bacterium]|nr:TatD family hydrolase [Candidatus Omnitrophota bacterium]